MSATNGPLIGLSTASVYPESTAHAFGWAASLGYDAVEVMVGIDALSQQVDAVKKLSDHHQVPICAVHAPCLLFTQRVWGTDPWGKLERSAEMAEAVGADVELRFDANQGYSAADARKFWAECAPAGVALVEQPTPAGEPHLLVVDPVSVDLDARVPRQPAEREHRASRADEPERLFPRLDRACGLDHDVRSLRFRGDGAERARERASLLARADADGPTAGVRDAGTEHEPDRPEPDDRDRVAAPHPRDVDPVQAAGERLRHRRELRSEAVRRRLGID